MKKKIGIDLDEVLNNMGDVWLAKYNKDYSDNLPFWSSWNVLECVKPECDSKIYDYLSEPNFFLNLEAKENAFEVIEWLKENFELYVVTAYSKYPLQDKRMWLEKFFPNIPKDNVIFINNKSLLDLDYLIDDGPHNIENFKKTAIIFQKEYNQHLVETGNYPVVKNWLEIKEYFSEKI